MEAVSDPVITPLSLDKGHFLPFVNLFEKQYVFDTFVRS